VCYALCIYGFGMLIHWGKYWLGHLGQPHTFSTVRFELVCEGRARRGMGFMVVVACGLWPAGIAGLFLCCAVPGQVCWFGGKLDV
jgi:hypothetical protein